MLETITFEPWTLVTLMPDAVARVDMQPIFGRNRMNHGVMQCPVHAS